LAANTLKKATVWAWSHPSSRYLISRSWD